MNPETITQTTLRYMNHDIKIYRTRIASGIGYKVSIYCFNSDTTTYLKGEYRSHEDAKREAKKVIENL